jgi:hypothetical protein
MVTGGRENVLESTPDVDVILLDKTLKEGGDGGPSFLHYLEFKERIRQDQSSPFGDDFS